MFCVTGTSQVHKDCRRTVTGSSVSMAVKNRQLKDTMKTVAASIESATQMSNRIQQMTAHPQDIKSQYGRYIAAQCSLIPDHLWEQFEMDITHLFHRYRHMARMGQQGYQWQPSFPPGTGNQWNQQQSMQQWNQGNATPRSSFGLGNISLTTLLNMDSGVSDSDAADGAAASTVVGMCDDALSTPQSLQPPQDY